MTNLFLRPSCYECMSRGENRKSDMTIADFWGVDNMVPDMFDDRGTSAVIINSERGYALFEGIQNKIKSVQVNIENITNYNSSYNESVNINKYRYPFFRKINECKSINRLINYYANGGDLGKIKRVIKRIIGRC